MKSKTLSFIIGFILLFAVYHFPEFFTAFWIMAVFKIGFLLVAFMTGRVQGWKGLEGFGLGLRTGWWRQLLKGLLLGLLFFGFAIVLSVSVGFERFQGFASFNVVVNQLPLLLLMTVFPSVAEDILTRGYLFGHLFAKMKPWGWVLLSAAVYVLNHIWRLTEDPAVLTYLFVFGVALAFTVWKTKSLWLAFGIHWGANIAFESTHSLAKTESIAAHYGSTWILAAVWMLLLLFFSLFPKAARLN